MPSTVETPTAAADLRDGAGAESNTPAEAGPRSRRRLSFFDAYVTQMRVEADGVLSVEFTPSESEAGTPSLVGLHRWKPGAHLDVLMGERLVRQFSLCSRPGEPLKVAVLREPESRGGSAHVHEVLRPGSQVRLRGPKNTFPLEPAEHYRFIAAGIGITPIIAMVREAHRRGIPWTLDYLGRSRETMAFVAELEDFGDCVYIHESGADGRFNLGAHLIEPDAGELAYACGPAGLLSELAAAAESWENPDLLRTELFLAQPSDGSTTAGVGSDGPGPSSAESGASLFDGPDDSRSTGDAPFTVTLTTGESVEVPADRSVLESLEDAGFAPLSSCREGICGTCETAVINGEVDHRDSLLSEEERTDSETMMICVSRSCGTSGLTLELE